MEQMKSFENQEPTLEQNERGEFDVVQANESEKGIMSRLAEGSSGTIGKSLRAMTLATFLLGSGMVAKEASAHPSNIPHMHDRAGVAHRVDGYSRGYRYGVQPGDEYKWQASRKPGQGDAYKRAAMGYSTGTYPYMSRTEVIIDRIADRLAHEIVEGIFPEKK